MKPGGDHHVFRDRDPGVPCLTHNQGRNPQKMGHVQNIGSLTPPDVDVTRTVHCARKPTGQMKLLGLIVVYALAFWSHCASMHTVYELLGSLLVGGSSLIPSIVTAILFDLR